MPYLPTAALVARSLIATAKPSPWGNKIITLFRFFLSHNLNAAYRSLAYSWIVVGEANLIAPLGVGISYIAIKPSPFFAIESNTTFAFGE